MAVSSTSKRTVADPNLAYESIQRTWLKNRAVCSGEQHVKDFDGIVDRVSFSNLLIPFSPSMTDAQYAFYKSEAELPGLVSLYVKFVVSGLLRKAPHLELPKSVPEEAKEWIVNNFSQDGMPLSSFLQDVLDEEVQTARAWIYVDYPVVENADDMTREDFLKIMPYPILWKAEDVINWQVSTDPSSGEKKLTRVFVKGYEETTGEDDFHPEYKTTIFLHEIHEGFYRIRKFQSETQQTPTLVQGQVFKNNKIDSDKFVEVDVNENIFVNGERLTFIPAWPANGSIEITEPFISQLVNREVSLYNKVSRRNHLLYGASTYTPVVRADITDEQFEEIVGAGLGSWIKIGPQDSIDVLKTPTDSLQDMDRAIAATVNEMAKMGIRMLSPETAESGIALEIRNAGQTATLGALNTKLSVVLKSIIAFMVKWRYDIEVDPSEVDFSLSADFNPAPLGADWLRLVTEWYQEGLLPRDVWLQILKQNDIIPGDYNDEDAKQSINADEFILPVEEQQSNDVPKKSKIINTKIKKAIEEEN